MREARAALPKLDLSPVEALMFPGGMVDFLTPPPTTPLPDFERELKSLLETPAKIVQQDIRNILVNRRGMYRHPVPEGTFAAYLDDPIGSLQRLADTLWRYWEGAMLPHWPRLQALLEADVMYRARSFALEGPERVFNELHPSLRFQDRTLQMLKKREGQEVYLELSGRGLLLIPSVFNDYSIMFDLPWQETLQYGARGTAGLWCTEPPSAGEALEKLLGHNRARLLKALATAIPG